MPVCGSWRITSGFLLLQILISITQAFNVDTEHSIVYSGQPGTFFGYAVAMAKYNDPNGTGTTPATIFIGAPKDNYQNQKTFNQTGVLYKCDSTPNSCSQSRVNGLGKYLGDGSLIRQVVDNGWIGGNIAVNPANTKLLTCGHRWREWSKDDHRIKVHMLGICYLGDIATDHTYQLVRSSKTKEHAGMGEDAVFSRDGSEIIVGAPGQAELSGAVVIFKTDNLKNERMIAPQTGPVKDNENSYAGYSVSSGRFFKDKQEYIVIGAPRYNNSGLVYIVSKTDVVKQRLFHSNQLGAYFGASLCVTDINKDGFDDLLVGVPLYSKKFLEGGAVMLYLSDGQDLIYNQTIWGIEVETIMNRGQFGTAIKDVGDINNDGYHDIVIGAPYENDQEGAIYVYNLAPQGFPANFSQRIPGKSVAHGEIMKGFGISISRAVDINADSYPDFLVGSYLSSQVRLLKSRPVIDLDIKATTRPERIDVNKYNCPPPNSKSICLDLDLEVSYQTQFSYLPSNIELDCKLHTEVSSLANNASSSVHRALIKDGSQYAEAETFSMSLSNTSPTKRKFTLMIKDKTDVFSPIEVFLDYKLRDGSLTSCPQLCPVLNGNQYKKLIHYKLDCGADKKCSSDLHLSMNSNEDHILYGRKPTFRLNVSVFNRGESAYNSLVVFNFPSYVQYVQVTNTEVTECSSDNSAEGGELVRCSLGNPIPKGYNVTFTMEFTNAGSLKENEIEIRASVTTKSEDMNLADNKASVKIPVRMKADITFNGFSEPDWLQFSEETSLLTHNFVIYNGGPSPLLDSRIRIILPELSEFIAINCDKSENLKNCTTEFPLENLDYRERKSIKVVLNVAADIFKKAKDIKVLKSMAVLTRKHNPLYLDNDYDWSLKSEIVTNLQTETKPVSLWVIIISILAGLIVLALLIVVLWKVGFFKRKKAGDMDPLTEDGKNAEQKDEKETLQESNGNTAHLVQDEEKIALSQQTDVQNVVV